MIFFRRVVGESMMPSLKPGKIVWAHEVRDFKEKQVVIAFVNGREVVKRISVINNGTITLSSDNKKSSSNPYARIPDKDVMGVVFWPKV